MYLRKKISMKIFFIIIGIPFRYEGANLISESGNIKREGWHTLPYQ